MDKPTLLNIVDKDGHPRLIPFNSVVEVFHNLRREPLPINWKEQLMIMGTVFGGCIIVALIMGYFLKDCI